MRDRENLAGSAPRYPHFANHLIQKKESISRLLVVRDSGGIDAAATLYCVFPLESSAKHNKKAVQCTAVFVIRATICEQAPIVPLTTKATLASGFLFCALRS